MTIFIAYLIMKSTPQTVPHPIACSNPVKCHVVRGMDKREPSDKPRR